MTADRVESSPDEPADGDGSWGPLVQVFKPTQGGAIAVISLVIGAAVLVGLAVFERTLYGAKFAAVLVWIMFVTWLALLRPRAYVYREVAVLRNILSEWVIPLSAITDVIVRQQLYVYVEDDRYACAAIGRSARNLVRGSNSNPGALSVLGFREHTAASQQSLEDTDYTSFVEIRLTELAEEARRHARHAGAVRRVWQRPLIGVLLALTALAAVMVLV